MGVRGRSQRHAAWNCHEGLRPSSWHSEEGSGTLIRYIYSHPHPHFEEVFTTRGGELDEGSDDVMFYKRAGSRLGLGLPRSRPDLSGNQGGLATMRQATPQCSPRKPGNEPQVWGRAGSAGER